MTNNLLGFLIWALVGLLFEALGIYSIVSKRGKQVAFGFWANAKVFPVEQVKEYNRTVGKLWCIFGAVFIILGIPLLLENKALIILSIIGVMFEAIVTMVIYTIKIEKKYRSS
jgi:hypothetical protein